ncbi:OsmC family protein [Chitinophagaceae bacterium MMS25-I14]
MTSKVLYQGDLRTIATHLQSGTTIETDAPVDNQGKGERFSPTDLVATALASCMATVMGIAARTHNIDIDGTRFDVEKVMAANPRRIGEIKINITFPKDRQYEDRHRSLLQKAAMTCPVIESLHPDLKKTVLFIWP